MATAPVVVAPAGLSDPLLVVISSAAIPSSTSTSTALGRAERLQEPSYLSSWYIVGRAAPFASIWLSSRGSSSRSSSGRQDGAQQAQEGD